MRISKNISGTRYGLCSDLEMPSHGMKWNLIVPFANIVFHLAIVDANYWQYIYIYVFIHFSLMKNSQRQINTIAGLVQDCKSNGKHWRYCSVGHTFIFTNHIMTYTGLLSGLINEGIFSHNWHVDWHLLAHQPFPTHKHIFKSYNCTNKDKMTGPF